jgi:hypothetical protein
MNKHILRAAALVTAIAFASGAYALPSLQTNITGGYYDDTTDTIIGGTTGTLNVYGVTPDGDGNEIDTTIYYYVSIAIVPQGTTLDTFFGSFEYNDTTYDSSNMVFGTPPLDIVPELMDPNSDTNDLAPHGIFETSFAEEGFMFNTGRTSSGANMQDTPGFDPAANSGGNELYYMQFNYDATGLEEGFHLHFDLYSSVVRDCSVGRNPNCVIGDIDVDDFAPFSHDSQSNGDDICCRDIAEPGSLGLMLIGMMGVGASRIRRRGKKA